jgi:hypothetical protein
MHRGQDFAANDGTPIYAAADSVVEYIGEAQGFRQWIVLRHNGTGESSVYGHMWNAFATGLREGQHVDGGQLIAYVGNNGESTGPHLHFEIHPGKWAQGSQIDPAPWLSTAQQPKGDSMPATTGDPLWLADVLRAKRPPLKVVELPDWQQYGHGDFPPDIWGVMIHHTGNARADAMSIRNGRPDLMGPLSNLHIAQDGTVTVVAAGVCWHAGAGEYLGIPSGMGNQKLIGIECAWPRDTSITQATETRERWPDAEIIAMRDSVAAILAKLGRGPNRVIAHKEYAGRAQGKWDPGNLSMAWFREEVGKSLRGEFDQPTPPPAPTPAPLTDRQLLEAMNTKLDRLLAK